MIDGEMFNEYGVGPCQAPLGSLSGESWHTNWPESPDRRQEPNLGVAILGKRRHTHNDA